MAITIIQELNRMLQYGLASVFTGNRGWMGCRLADLSSTFYPYTVGKNSNIPVYGSCYFSRPFNHHSHIIISGENFHSLPLVFTITSKLHLINSFS